MSDGRLLILDDDPHIGKMIQLIAESVGVAARFMTDTASFFRSIDDWHPTHLAIDLVMPEMDGVEVLVKLADRRCGAAIIITSGVGARVLDAAGRSASEHGLNIAGVLPKPFSTRTLRALLSGVPVAEDKRDGASLYARSRCEATHVSASTVSDLRRALDNRELTLVFQPQIHCQSGALAGFEALARWPHATRGSIPPDQFIALAEQHGLIHELTDQVLDLALTWYAEHLAGSDLTVAVNLSGRATSRQRVPDEGGPAVIDSGMIDGMIARCRTRGIKPESLVLELTETSAMDNPVTALDLLTRLRMKGFQLSIDDFGTGYSSMLQLVRLPFSEIKVDKSFVNTAIRSIESRAVVKSIIGLGHSLGLRVVGEGVEDPETLRYLTGAGCDLAQGYHIARPMTGDATLRWMEVEAERAIVGLR